MAPSSILVLGLGELGYEVVHSLANHSQRDNANIDVLLRSRKQEQVDVLQTWNVGIVEGNVVEDSVEKLSTIFGRYHTVICCTGMFSPPETQVKVARAALAGKVERYFPWQFGIDYDIIGRNSSQDMFDSQLDVRGLMRGQTATQWVIVSTGMFIPFLFEPSFDLVNEDRSVVTAIGSWDNSVTVTAPKDIGKIVADIALRHMDVQGVVFASGDTITMSRLADIVEEVTGNTVQRRLKTVSDLKAELAEQPEDGMRKYRVVFAEGVGVSWPRAESYNARHGIETQTVVEWAKHNNIS